MGLDTGCNYCSNLECTKEPLLEFKCNAMPKLKIENAGACFVAMGNNKFIVIQDCPEFKKS